MSDVDAVEQVEDRPSGTGGPGGDGVPAGPGTRRPPRREGDQLRVELLAAAADLATGPRPVAIPSLRGVARAVGVSPTAVYRHFPSQSALTRSLLVREYDAFERVVLAADDVRHEPRERLRRLANAFVQWGLANPGLYQLLFESADQLDDECMLVGASEELVQRLGILVHDLAGPRGGGDDAAAAEQVMTALHGIVSLRIHKPTTTWVTDPVTLVDHFLPG